MPDRTLLKPERDASPTPVAKGATTSNTAQRLVVPPELGLVQLAIPGFASLGGSERLQAAALALRRDLGVAAEGLRLAAVPVVGNADAAAIAYFTDRTGAATGSTTGATTSAATNLLGIARPSQAYWFDAPAGFLVGAGGAAVVDDAANAETGLPAAAAAMFATMFAATGTAAGATANAAQSECVLINRNPQGLTDETLAYWGAAGGVRFVDGILPTAPVVSLQPVPVARTARAATPLDRGLYWSLAAALACLALAAFRFVSVPAQAPGVGVAGQTNSSPGTSGNKHGAPGALLERIGVIAPDVLTQLQSATYASGAWVLALNDGMDAAAVRRAVQLLEANGLAVQATQTPSPRLRVALP